MAIKKLDENAELLQIEINNGDFKALSGVTEKWRFIDKESAMRFALAVLTMTTNGSLYQKKEDGSMVALQPMAAIITKEN